MLNLEIQRAAIKPYLNMQFLFVVAALDDYRKMDFLVHTEGLDLNVALAKATRDQNAQVKSALEKYKKLHDLIAAVKSDNADQVQSLLAEGVDKTMALLLTTFRDDNDTAIKFINMDSFTPGQTTKEPLLMKQLMQNSVLRTALINHRNEEIKSQWLLLEAAYRKLAFNKASSNEDPVFLSGMKILSDLPGELQMDIVGMNNPLWLEKHKGELQITHLYKAAAQSALSPEKASVEELTRAMHGLFL